MELLEAVVLCDTSLVLFNGSRSGDEAAASGLSRAELFGFCDPHLCSSADGLRMTQFGFKTPAGHFLRNGFARRANIDAGHFLLAGIGG
eukprot:3444552-Amphidinium_carterae.1